MKSVSQIALNDITKHVETLRAKQRHSLLEYEQSTKFYSCFDNWFVSRDQLKGKETTRLNRLLGLHRINHIGNTNGTRTK